MEKGGCDMKKKTISTIGYNQIEIIQNIIELHVPQGFIDLDPTYSRGVFYKKGLLKDPEYKFDLIPQTSDTTQSCVTDLPMDDNSVNCIMFDPPFIMGGKIKDNCKDGSCIIGKRFSYFKNPTELLSFYRASLLELYRILDSDGVLIFKCQDCVVSAKNCMSHAVVMKQAYDIGFYPKDLFILLAKSRLISGKVKKQQHARKFHSYFWVFEKRNSKLDYNDLIG